MLEPLEEELSPATRAERLVATVPDRVLAAAQLLVGGTKLLDRRPACARGHEHFEEIGKKGGQKVAELIARGRQAS